MSAARILQSQWQLVAASMRRPYRVTFAMVVLVALVPAYLFIPGLIRVERWNAPALPLDGAIPLQPAWSLVYGALYGCLIVLPVLAIRQQEHIRRAVRAYLLAWVTAYLFFIVYPTVAPRPALVSVETFGGWSLSLLYGADPPYNCFPSLHVAHSFVSAFALGRLHRGIGRISIAAAALVALSTLFTKQHYVLDVIAGVLLATVAYALFLRQVRPESAPEEDRRAVPALAALVAAGAALVVLTYRIAFELV